MQAILLGIHVLLALAIIGLVLIQQGRGADAGAAFGSGSSGTLFGAGGSGSFLTRMTTAFATLFFVTSLALAVMAAHRGGETGSVVDTAPAAEERQAGTDAADGAAAADEGAGGADRDTGGTGSDLPPIEE